MILYKYFPPERIDVLQQLKIRFSQPRIYNDPFEINPRSTSDISEELFNNIMPILIRYYDGPKEEIIKLKKITYANFQKDQTFVLFLIREVMASGSLALCLTETPNSLLMWAHYGFFHKGFVIGFDTTNSFFTCPQGSYFLKPIIYQKQRPIVTFPNPNILETYFTKSIEWSYEKEWRLFRRLQKTRYSGASAIDCEGWPIYIFDFPSEAVREIIMGCRMENKHRNLINSLVEKKFSSVSIKTVRLSDNKYKLIFI